MPRLWTSLMMLFAVPLASASEPIVLLPGKQTVSDVAFSADGKSLALGHGDGRVLIFDIAQRKTKTTITHTRAVVSVAFHPTGSRLAFGDDNGTVRIWDLAKDREFDQIENVGKHVRQLAFSPSGNLLAFAVRKKIGLWDISGKAARFRRSAYLRGNANGFAFSADGKHLVSASRADQAFSLWKITPKGLVLAKHLRRSSREGWAVATAEKDTFLLADGTEVLALDLKHNRATDLGKHRGVNADVRRLIVSRNGRLAASLAMGDGIRVWNVKARKQVVLLPGKSVTAIAFSPDGKSLVAASSAGVRLFRVAR